MQRDRVARGFFALTSAVAFVALALALHTALSTDNGVGSTFDRFLLFTTEYQIWPTALIAITTAMLARRLDRPSAAFRVARYTALVAVVFPAGFAWSWQCLGYGSLPTSLMVVVASILALAGWLIFGPRRQLSARAMWATLTGPFAWLLYALLVSQHFGADSMTGNSILVTVQPFIFDFANDDGSNLPRLLIMSGLYLGVAFLGYALDRRLGRGRANGMAPAT
jgi:hypothetical protein